MNGREISEIFGCLLLVLGVLVVLVSLLFHIVISSSTNGVKVLSTVLNDEGVADSNLRDLPSVLRKNTPSA